MITWLLISAVTYLIVGYVDMKAFNYFIDHQKQDDLAPWWAFIPLGGLAVCLRKYEP